ncbi:MAG: peptidylprolyl isomerase [Wenzhouxiangellaceae bacterium]
MRIFELDPGRLLLAFVLLGWMWPLAAMAQSSYQEIDEIVAVVDEGVILRSELEQALRAVETQIRARGEALPPRQVLEEQVLDRLIDQQVQLQRAEATGIRISDQAVDRALEDIARQNGITLAQLRAALEGEGGDFSEFREEVRRQLTLGALRNRIVESMEEPTETEIELLMASDDFDADEYDLSQIVIRLPANPTQAQMREAEAKVQEVMEALQGGMDFAAAAVRYSGAPDALEGGRVGWRNLNSMPRELADAIRGKAAGEIIGPIVAGNTVLIVRVNDRRAQDRVMVDEYQARHILVSPTELVSEERARALIEELRERILAGEDFASLAREYSNDTRSANLGGLLDWFPRGAYGEQVQRILDGLEPGEVSEPFQSPSGWHIVKLEGRRTVDRTEEVRRSEARNMLMERRAQQEVEDMLQRFRDEAYIEKRIGSGD